MRKNGPFERYEGIDEDAKRQDVPGKDNKADNNAATHATPGAIRDNNSGSGPITKGNNVITIRKNHNGLRISACLRMAICNSRLIICQKIMPLLCTLKLF